MKSKKKIIRVQSWWDKYWLPTMIGVALCLLSALVLPDKWQGYKRTEAEKMAAQLRAKREQLQHWAPIPFTPLAAQGNLPQTPRLPPYPNDIPPDAAKNAVGSPGFNALYERLMTIVRWFPKSEINHDLNQRIQDGTVFFNFSAMPGSEAMFSDGSAHAIFSRSNAEVIEGASTLPTFSFNAESLAMIETPEEIVGFGLITFHEYWHYRYQWLPANDEYRARYFRPGSASVIDVEHCTEIWHHEYDAYLAECRLAAELNAAGFMALCERVENPAAFNQALFSGLTEAHEKGGSRLRSCKGTWARLAGHPHPEAFE